MDKLLTCRLCETTLQFFSTCRNKDYYHCPTCEAIQMDKDDYLNKEEEKARYETHNNDVEDPNYQKFVSPIVNAVMADYSSKSTGLDYGAGTGPVITKMLRDQGYEMTLYDPYFWNDPSALNSQYDFIASCEVIEHFHHPKEEFNKLSALLKPTGSLYLKTDLYDATIDFEKWYYKNDPTHVFFYQKKTFEWIKDYYKFTHLAIHKRMIHLKK